MNYFQRMADSELAFKLDCAGAVLIEGPKWCGKTTTAKQQAKSIIELQNPDKRAGYAATAQVKPSLLLEGEKPRLIDEWQELPVLWDSVRLSVDNENTTGLYILTGSNSVNKKEIHHSGTGRISRMKMETMSLYESKESNGSVSLKSLFENPKQEIAATSQLSIEELIFAACRGGWPAFFTRKSDAAKLQISKDYIESVCQIDISSIDNVSRNPNLTRLILKSYARNIATLAKNSSILKDVETNTVTLSMDTLTSYLTALERLFVIQNIDAWCPSIRSASAIRAGKKRCFCDPSIAVAALGINPDFYKTDLKSFGFIFENLCIRDLRAYSSKFNSHLSYYHDRYDLEADCVLHLSDGRYALIEFKLGSKEIEEGAEHLLEIKSLIKKHNENQRKIALREPDLLLIITGGEFAYRRADGIFIVPVGCLKD